MSHFPVRWWIMTKVHRGHLKIVTMTVMVMRKIVASVLLLELVKTLGTIQQQAASQSLRGHGLVDRGRKFLVHDQVLVTYAHRLFLFGALFRGLGILGVTGWRRRVYGEGSQIETRKVLACFARKDTPRETAFVFFFFEGDFFFL